MRLLTVLLLVILLLPSSTAQAATCPPAPAIARVMPTGDSITMGAKEFSPRPWNGFRKPLKDRLTSERYASDLVGNSEEGTSDFADRQFAGWAGWSIEAIRSNIAGWIGTYRPSVILLLAGTNDMFDGKNDPPATPANAPERMETLLELIYEADPCVAVVVSEIPPIWGPAPGINPDADYAGQWVQPFNDALPAIVSRREAAGQRIVLQSISGIVGDGLHLLASEDEIVADRWLASLRSFPGLLARTPAAPSPINPNATLTTRRPTFRWHELEDPVNEYALYDLGPSGAYDLVKTYPPDICQAGVCAAEAPANLQDGPHSYWLIAWNASGWGLWSDAHHYCITTCTVTRPPAPTVTAGFPTITWTDIGGAVDGYAVYDLDENVGQYDLVVTVDGHDPCSDGVCALLWPFVPSYGWHRVWVIAWNAAGWGQWSEAYTYCVSCTMQTVARPSPSPEADR